MKRISRVNVKDMGERMRLDEAHAMDVHRGSKNWQVVVGDELVAFDPLIGAKVYNMREHFVDGSSRFDYTFKDVKMTVYVWIEKSKQYIALGTRKDIVGEIGEEEVAKLDVLFEEAKRET